MKARHRNHPPRSALYAGKGLVQILFSISFILAASWSNAASSAKASCRQVFAASESSGVETQMTADNATNTSARTYENAHDLPRMTEHQVSDSIKSLAALRLNIEVAKSKGINSILQTALKTDFKNKEQELIDFTEQQKIMTRAELIEKLKYEISILQRPALDTKEKSRRRAERTMRDTIVDGSRVFMNRVEPGAFRMGKMAGLGNPVDVTLTKPFEMMATHATQMIWRKIADLANTKLNGEYKYKINLDPSKFKGDLRPVEKVSYNQVQEWIEALNDLSQIGAPELNELILGHKQGDIYRLPTEAEWEFVVRGRGKNNGKFFFGDDESQMGRYMWFKGNSRGKTHPVALKEPLIINDQKFYDMHGNVSDWVQDSYQINLPGGFDPVVNDHWTRVFRGGDWTDNAELSNSGFRRYSSPVDINGSSFIGFRLVREPR